MTDISKYVKRTRPEHAKGDGALLYQCPQCNGHQKLEVDIRKGVWYCHKCGVGGRIKGKSNQRLSVGHRDCYDPEQVEELLQQFHPALRGKAAWRYLEDQRKLGPSLISQLRPHSGPSLLRVYFPLYPLGGTKPHYFVGRIMDDTLPLPKYLHPAIGSFLFRKMELLWGLHRFRGSVDTLVLCEGILDAVHGTNRVALLGKSLSEPQIRILKKLHPREIVFLFDGGTEKESTYAATKLMKYFSGRISRVTLPVGKDPDSLRDVSEWYHGRETLA